MLMFFRKILTGWAQKKAQGAVESVERGYSCGSNPSIKKVKRIFLDNVPVFTVPKTVPMLKRAVDADFPTVL
jgi:hypothetical protein